MARRVPVPVASLGAGARAALAALDAAPVPVLTAVSQFGHAPLAELKAGGRAFCDCTDAGELTAWASANWWIAQNQKLIGSMAAAVRRSRKWCEYHDLFQEGIWFVYECVPRYEHGRCQFRTYAATTVRQSLLGWARKVREAQRRAGATGDEAVTDSAPAPTSRGGEEVGAIMWAALAAVLSEREYTVLSLKADGLSLLEIGRELGLERSEVQRIETDAHRKVRESGALAQYGGAE
jgi:RNA polymerase sigma factor (sigma-70 family)